MANRILIVEDEEKLARMVELELTYEGYQVEKALDGRTGLERALSGEHDLILLDILLPGLNGLEVLRRYRKDGGSAPVILLTARDTVVDKVAGLDSGADDYVTKPFAIEELLARIRAALRKRPAQAALRSAGGRQESQSHQFTAGPVTLDPDSRKVTVNGTPVELTRREFDLLACLLEHKGKVLSRSAILNTVWGYDYVGETNTVDVYIRFLRSKLDEVFGIHLIETVRGVGYVIRGD